MTSRNLHRFTSAVKSHDLVGIKAALAPDVVLQAFLQSRSRALQVIQTDSHAAKLLQ